MKGVLFLCTGNSCRSQMAEGFARVLAPPGVRVHSAGTHPVGLHPLALRVMAEIGIDISDHESKDLSAVPLDEVDTLVTLCGDADERCPQIPGIELREHWPIPDPARPCRSEAERLAAFRAVRDEIGERVRRLFGLD